MDHHYNQIPNPGSIQPHGVMLILNESLEIVQVSDNVDKFLGKEPEDLLNQTLDILLDTTQILALEELLKTTKTTSNFLKLAFQEQYFDAIVHRSQNHIVVELEPTNLKTDISFLSVHHLINDAINQMQQTSQLRDFMNLVTSEVKKITNYDRVMVYQFDTTGAGSVIAEAKQEQLSRYLGLHYPASDIPEPVRKLYTTSPLRFIPDINAKPSQLIASQSYHHQPLDLGKSVLRSVDPCCVSYHDNMGVAGLLVIALIQEQKLWGLISCHHYNAKHLPYEIRAICEFLGQVISLELGHLVIQEELDYKNKLKSLQTQFITSISNAENFLDALIYPAPRLLELVNAYGCAVCLDNEITLVGVTPNQEQVYQLIEWMDININEDLFSTNSLAKLYPAAETFKNTASGLILLRISRIRRYYILWFRPEVIQTVNWGGNPNLQNSLKPSPRHSFELWQETVHLTSQPWKQCELDSALDLRNAIVGIVINKADELAKINLELERSNRELDSFAYAASHDLKEPLRGIHNYSTILIEDYAHLLDEEGIDCLNTLVSLTQRMDILIDVLLRLSQLGQTELRLQSTNLNNLINRVLEVIRASRQQVSFEIRIPQPLPTIECDPVLVNEVFSNLISNGLKYNNCPDKTIEIGYLEPSNRNFPIFYVRDNGIGIQAHHFDTIFRLFKRLHSQEKYGGGAGAGLAITKKIVERHHGKIWVESIYGEGSTFFFTLECINTF